MLRDTCGTLVKEPGFGLDAISDMLGREGAATAAWYARDAGLEKKLAGVAVKIRRTLFEQKCLTPPTRVSNPFCSPRGRRII
jgi:hypothetical protein